MTDTTLEGWVSVRAAIVSGSRDVHELWLQKDKDSNNIKTLKKRARDQDIPVKLVAQKEIDSRAEGKSHGGVLAFVGERKFLPLDELGKGSQATFLAMLDGVEDPYNFAQAVRALYACGVHGLILRPRNWTTAASTIARASAGTTEFMRMAITQSDDELIHLLHKRNIQLVCSDLNDKAKNPREAKLNKPLLLVIGGEKRGISKTLLNVADLTLQIPYGRAFKQSLGVTSSAAILGYEIMQQRSMNASTFSKTNKKSNFRVSKKKTP